MAFKEIFFVIIFISIKAQGHNGRLEEHKWAVTSVKSHYGDIYDCVDINKQPSLDHPTLLNHKIKMRPNKKLHQREEKLSTSRHSPLAKIECPKGSVPIRRIDEQQAQNARSAFQNQNIQLNSSKVVANYGLEFAGIQPENGIFHGAKASISLYNPYLFGDQQYSSAMISIEKKNASQLNQIKVGWMVNPKLYGDTRTRFFTSWTNDNYESTGCYNTHCPGFIITTSSIPLDYAFPNTSDYHGRHRFEMQVNVFQEEDGHWWLYLEHEEIGYWPKTLFTSLNVEANVIRFGGEVFSLSTDKITPEMGSGTFGTYDNTCYMRGVSVMNNYYGIVDPPGSKYAHTLALSHRCYWVFDDFHKDDYLQYSFRFGGADGRDHLNDCPFQ